MDKELKELKDRKELKVHKELDHHQLEAKGLKDNQDYLEDQDLQVPKALKELRAVRIKCEKTPESYPPDYVLSAFMAGAYKRSITALSRGPAGSSSR